jgi:hypothetical protein
MTRRDVLDWIKDAAALAVIVLTFGAWLVIAAALTL